jgi:two-component system, LuxR family, sensor kinase FixL
MTSPWRFHPNDDPSRFLAAIVDSSEDAIIGKDLEGTIVSWNRGAERLYGYTAREVIGRSITLLMPPDRQHELEAVLERVRSGVPVQAYETVRQTADGRLLEVSLTISSVLDPNGQVVGAATIARDITARKQAERERETSESRWRAVVESAVDGIVVIDASGRIEAFNPAAERLFGYQEGQVVGQNVNILMPSPHHEAHDGYLARYLATGDRKIIGIGREVVGRRRDGTTFPLHLSVGEIIVGNERKFTGILHDLTARARLETQLREQAALVKLGEMAAVLAHEVKNPLAGIRGAVQVIGGRFPSDSREATIMKEIVTRIDGLNGLMKDLLLYARPPQPRPMPVDVADVVMATADLLKADPAVSRVQVTLDGSAPPILADPELLKIVFVNLLVNGAHAMRGEGRIRVSVTSTDGTCDVAFRDDGPGIPPEIRERIFTPFFTTKSRGSGLGLPTAKRLIEAHAGTIHIDSPLDGGTTVTVRLPVQT